MTFSPISARRLWKRTRSPGSILTDPLGPLWYRGLITRGPAFEQEVAAAATAAGKPNLPRPPIAQELDMVLAAFGAKRLVVGHTPNLAGIAVSHGGKLAMSTVNGQSILS